MAGADDSGSRRPRRTRYGAQVGRGDLTLAEFERIVAEALDSLPKRFADMVHNVVISVEEEPNAEDLESLGPDAGEDELLGIYRGVALTERSYEMQLMPDEIAVFRGPILRSTRTRREAVDEVRETIVHELGHYFGLDDDEMDY
jgi:predicted Zn-dependent protease with MMP-like domain